jgi:2-polyprenyl-3-methyl-5-hydroxy-6-metoxy-1,4-benzoquinol methylase
VPFRNGGRLAVCTQCGAAQSPADQQWLSEIREIYGSYNIYRQAGGAEQQVFDQSTSLMRGRSEMLVERLLALPGVPVKGKLLDVGCGTGGTLKAFASHGNGNWTLFALDLDDRNLEALNAVSGFRTLYNCEPTEVPGQFDIITLVHSLEHFPSPFSTLIDLRSKLDPEGYLFIEVPDAAVNPFDYTVADHRVHFTTETLAYLVRRSGFSVEFIATDWVTKEISLVAVRGNDRDLNADIPNPNSHVDVFGQVVWLSDFVVAALKSAATAGPFGLFGTGMGATWLWPTLSDRIEFFVDEDPSRVGRTHMGRPILSPAQIPCGAVVFIALVPTVATNVQTRLAHLPVDFRIPPPLV